MTYNHDPYGGYSAKKKDDTPQEDPNAVPSGTISEIKDWVGDDKDRAQKALDAEKANEKPRKTLVEDLEDILNG
jgi:hypothetical protein